MPVLSLQTDRPLRGAPVAVIDFETTGLASGERHPVQIAVVRAALGDDIEAPWTTLVRPPVPIPPEAAAIHGISDADVADAPTFSEVADEVLSRIDGCVLCAYNLPFDQAVLAEALALLDRAEEAPALAGLDPLVWAKSIDKYERGKRLEDVARRRGIEFAAHDAEADVTTTASLMPRLLRELGTGGHVAVSALHRIDAFWQWQQKTALDQETDYLHWRLRNGREPPELAWHRGLGVPLPPPAGGAP